MTGRLTHTLMHDLALAWRNVLARRVQTGVAILVVGLALALFIAVAVLGDGIRRGVIRAADPFGVLVVGPKGSAQQLVLNTVLLQGQPVGAIPYSVYRALQADPRVALAVPIAMADNVGGARIIGTAETFFQLTTDAREPLPFQFADGRPFADRFEAVLGAAAAAQLDLGIGDQFVAGHGPVRTLNEDVHDDAPFLVVGILQSSNTPFDTAVFVSMESVWDVHAEDHADEEHADEEHAGEEHADEEHADEDHTDENELTAVLVKPTTLADAGALWQEFFTGDEAQAAFPGRELGLLFDWLQRAEQILTAVGYLAAAMAGLTVLLAVYGAVSARQQMIAVLRGLGASRGSVLRMVLFEALLIALIGALLGRALGYGAAWLIADNLTRVSAVPLPLRYLVGLEPLLWGLPLALGSLAGLWPALLAYRVDVVEKLFGAS